MLTSICRSIVTICSGLYLCIGMTSFSSKWILSHSTWYKNPRSGQLARRKGSRLIVRSQDEFTRVTRAQDLDATINAVIRVAREGGHSLQELRQRVRERLLAQPP